MVGLLTNTNTTISITENSGSQIEMSGEIYEWNASGFDRKIVSKSTFGTTFINRSPVIDGIVDFKFKFKNYIVTGSDLFSLSRGADAGSIILTESAPTPIKITIKWDDGSNEMIRCYYNVYGISSTSAGTSEDLPTANIKFIIPPFNEGGESNFRQSLTFADETAWDTLMGW